jgi:hypothetical protein
MSSKVNTHGELLFEQYLLSQGYTEFEHERQSEGKSKRPDYTVRIGSEEYLFEVKDFVQVKSLPPMGSFDDYTPIRVKIDAGRKKFKEYKDAGLPCCLVLYNVNMPLLDLHSPEIMFGAMEGDFGISMLFDVQRGRVDESTISHAFLDGGKMVRAKTSEPQNTTISALITLRHVHIGSMRYRKYFREGFKLPKDQQDDYFSTGVDFDTEEKHLGVIVWENRVAKVPFSNQIFRGDYDERYIYDGNHVTRVFAGPGVLEYEELRPADEV